MEKMIVWMIFGSKLLSLFCNVSNLLLSQVPTPQADKQTGTLKMHNSGLDRLGATQFLTLRNPCLGRDPYFGNHCSNRLKKQAALAWFLFKLAV